MATTLTPKQETFCQAYVETGNASEAYRSAYPRARNWKPESVHRKAHELLGNVKVLARVEALKAEHRQRHAITVDSLVADLLRIRQAAEADGQLNVARQSVMDVAKLLGLVVDRAEQKLNLAGELTTEKAVLILQSMGIKPEVNHAKH